MEKDTSASIGSILIMFFLVMVVLSLTMACYAASDDVAAFYAAKDRYVELEAKISSFDHYVETDEGFEQDYWRTYVSYTYNGNEYTGVEYETLRSEPEIGKAVKVRIDPEIPNELLPNTASLGLAVVLAPAFLTLLSLAGLYLTGEGIQKVASKLAPNKQLPLTVTVVIGLLVVGAVLFVESLVFYIREESLCYGVFSLIALVVSAVVFTILKKINKNKKASA